MSEAWRSEKVRQPYEVAKVFADYIAQRMPAGVEWHFGGSYRRHADQIGDIDFVVVTESGLLDDGLFGGVQLPAEIEWQRGGKAAAFGDLTLDFTDPFDTSKTYQETMHIDVWACTPKQRGAFLWFITGPQELNIAMRQRALKLGMHLPQGGLFVCERPEDGKHDKHCHEHQVDNGTEEHIAELLGWDMETPEQRQRWAKSKPAFGGKAAEKSTIAVNSSKGGKVYKVTKIGGVGVECTCPGFNYRRTCKHLTMKAEVTSEEDE